MKDIGIGGDWSREAFDRSQGPQPEPKTEVDNEPPAEVMALFPPEPPDTLPCVAPAADKLRQAILEEYGIDPLTDCPPREELLDSLTEGMRQRIGVSKGRHAEYRDEPWRFLPGDEHARHGAAHSCAALYCTDGNIAHLGAYDNAGDGRLHAAHAALRLDFYMYQVTRCRL